MWRGLWTTTVVGSLLALIASLASILFDSSKAPKQADPYAEIIHQPPENFPVLPETGSGHLAVKESPTRILNESTANEELSDSQDSKNLEPKRVSEDQTKAQTAAQLDSIQKELAELPGGPESAPARTLLLHNASSLALDDRAADQVHELAMDELLQAEEDHISPADQSTSFAYFLPVLAHEVALKTALDANEAFNITIDGLTVHRDPGVRYSLVRQFVTRYPYLEPQLREELYLRNIVAGGGQVD